MQKKKEKPWENDQAYIDYAKSGASSCVFIMRDVANVDTSGYWIDVSDIIQEEKNLPQLVEVQRGLFRHPRYTAINSFKAELFPRLTQPDYSTARDDDEIRYITWLTATADILKQKSDGYVGKKYEVTVETIPVLDEKNPLIIKRKFKVIMTKRLNSRLKHD